MKRIIYWALLVAFFMAGQTGYGHSEKGEKEGEGKKVYVAGRQQATKIRIDGKISPQEWGRDNWQSGFRQTRPQEGNASSQRTSFKIVYDNNSMYVAIRAHDEEASGIVSRMAKRDAIDGDWVNITIDSYFDHRTAFAFSVSAAGVKGDWAVSDDGRNWDSSWDAIWFAKTSHDANGWYTEMKIPLTQLRFAEKEQLTWGFQVMRHIYRNDERVLWQFIPNEASGWIHRYAELHGLKDLKPRRLVGFTPYVVARHERYPAEAGNPFATGKGSDLTVGLDGQYGLTNDITLNYTVNPDFGQVEADPSQVNLSAYESYLREKRPFFTEGKSIFDYRLGGGGGMGRDNLFYTRRIGRSPQLYPGTNDGEYADVPGNTTILGAAKLTGKTPGGLSVGIVESITAEEQALVSDGDTRRSEIVEPLTNYSVARLQQNLNNGQTLIGGILTMANRRLNTEALRHGLHKNAVSGGVDFTQFWKDKTYFMKLSSVYSYVDGSQEALRKTQESPAHYFQRPDAPHLNYDSTRTSLAGQGGTLEFGKSGQGHWRYSAKLAWRSPGLELNDIGYMRGTDHLHQSASLGYRYWEQLGVLKNFRFNLNQWAGWDFVGTSLYQGAGFSARSRFTNFWSFNMGGYANTDGVNKDMLRGGPSVYMPGSWGAWTNIHSDPRMDFSASAGASLSNGYQQRENNQSLWVRFRYRPLNSLLLSVRPSLSLRDNRMQYVSTESFLNKSRYVLASISQQSLRMEFRVNYSISPEFAIQYYGQPFVASGSYSNFKYITSPKAAQYTDRFALFSGQQLTYSPENQEYTVDEDGDGAQDYTFGNYDFQRMDFMSNLVLRWEYIPGSAFFLVWSQARNESFGAGEPQKDVTASAEVLGGADAHNVFMMKLSYRFGT